MFMYFISWLSIYWFNIVALYCVKWIVHILDNALYSVQCTVYIAYFTNYSVHRPVYSVESQTAPALSPLPAVCCNQGATARYRLLMQEILHHTAMCIEVQYRTAICILEQYSEMRGTESDMQYNDEV